MGRRRPQLPANWQVHARRRSWTEARTMVWAGLLLGLLAFEAPRSLQPPIVIAEAPPTFGGSSERVTASVRVIDGDTFDHGGVRVRIADIDTPEADGRCAHETALAARATARMRALLAAGPFELHSIGGRDEDRYGRKLRIVTRGGQSLGDVLVAEGLARTWTGRRPPWCV
jgi:endonuclease YncB( thermonuclease family)